MSSAFARIIVLLALASACAMAATASAQSLQAQVHKANVEVHGAPDFKAAVLATLKQGATVTIAAQQGLWYRIGMPAGAAGYVRVNEVRMAGGGKGASSADVRGLFSGRAGKGRVSETAGVRGLDESDLRSAGYDGAQLAKMESYRETPEQAKDEMRDAGLHERGIDYAPEDRAVALDRKGGATQAEKRSGISGARGLLSRIGGNAIGDALFGAADKGARKNGQELTDEELQLGPQIAGRILGAAPLWQNDAAQRRVNRVGRWLASHTARPELPWTFGVIDSPEVNAFAAPGGYVLVTRGMYELVDPDDDEELAGVLAHELSHVVQRDHYEVIRKQELESYGKDLAMGQVNVGGGAIGGMAKDYLAKNGAAVMLTQLDRDAEYRSDEAAQVYLARSGYDPLALYAVLQKMAAIGNHDPGMAQLFRTHPPLDSRLDRLDRESIASAR
jgi:hypothetical protein